MTVSAREFASQRVVACVDVVVVFFICFLNPRFRMRVGQRGAVLPSVCAVHFVRLRRAGGSGGAAAAVAAGPARTALNRFSRRLQSGVKAQGERRAAASVCLPLGFAPSSSSASTGSVLPFLSRLAENEFEERDSPAWKFLCGLPWIRLLDAEVRSVFNFTR